MRYGSRQFKAAVFVGVTAVLLSLPMLRQLSTLQGPSIPRDNVAENRRLASLPDVPVSRVEIPQFIAGVDAYLNDRFGFREQLVRASASVMSEALSEQISNQIVIGRGGRIFLGNHSDSPPYSLIEEVCGLGVSSADVALIKLRLMRQLQLRSKAMERTLVVVVPTAPVLYPEHLPQWLAAQCARSIPPAQRLIHSWPHSMSNRLYYPIAELSHLKETTEAIPKRNFHWRGTAPHQIARIIARRFFGRQRTLTIGATSMVVPSDLAFLNPGAAWVNNVMEPDFVAAGIDVCQGLRCYPELSELVRIPEISFYRRKTMTTGSKLLVLSDSFGAGIAGYFIESFDQVVHVNVTQLADFTPEQRRLFDQWRRSQQPDACVLLFHDGALRSLDAMIDQLWTDATPAQPGLDSVG